MYTENSTRREGLCTNIFSDKTIHQQKAYIVGNQIKIVGNQIKMKKRKIERL